MWKCPQSTAFALLCVWADFLPEQCKLEGLVWNWAERTKKQHRQTEVKESETDSWHSPETTDRVCDVLWQDLSLWLLSACHVHFSQSHQWHLPSLPSLSLLSPSLPAHKSQRATGLAEGSKDDCPERQTEGWLAWCRPVSADCVHVCMCVCVEPTCWMSFEVNLYFFIAFLT